MYLKLERAEGGRQDLAFDGALPLFINRVMFLEFLRELVLVPDHQNILEDYLWVVLRSNEMTALLRVCALFDLLISRPMRWLSGKGSELSDWSIYKMGPVMDEIEHALVAITMDGSVLFDDSVDFFEGTAKTQPLFEAWRRNFFAQKVASPDGTKHAVFQAALDEARNPTNAGNVQATAKAIELAQLMANAALAKCHDKKLAISTWLTSQDGENAFGKRAREHTITAGCNTTNDCVESNFGTYDMHLKMFGTICPENNAGMTQQARNGDFKQDSHVQSDRRRRKADTGERHRPILTPTA